MSEKGKKLKVLITGATGFAGSHLCEHALKQGAEVFAMRRWRSSMDNLIHLNKHIECVHCDITDYASVKEILLYVKPDYIFHLAAQSYVKASWLHPFECMDTNSKGQMNILEVLRTSGLNTKIQIASSSEVYGLVLPNETPIKETNPLRPLSPYAVSKVTQDFMAYQYHKSYGIHTIRTRAFNHSGPRRSYVFVISNFARQIALIEKGKQEPIIHVGNLEAVRDFTDVRDMVRAYWLAIERGDPGDVYNIATGVGHKIKDVLDMLIDMSNQKVTIQEDEDRMRPSDVELLIGDATKFREKTEWEPEIPFERTVRDTLDYWRMLT